MNRRLAVLGLAVAMWGTVVAGQTAQKDAPVATTPAPPSTGGVSNVTAAPPSTGGVSNVRQASPATGGGFVIGLLPASAQPQMEGTVSFRVARLEPQGMRLSVIDGGVAKTTVEASSITVTTGPDGTTVTAEGTATVAMGDRTKISVEGLTLLLRPGGKLSGVSWSGLRQ